MKLKTEHENEKVKWRIQEEARVKAVKESLDKQKEELDRAYQDKVAELENIIRDEQEEPREMEIKDH